MEYIRDLTADEHTVTSGTGLINSYMITIAPQLAELPYGRDYFIKLSNFQVQAPAQAPAQAQTQAARTHGHKRRKVDNSSDNMTVDFCLDPVHAQVINNESHSITTRLHSKSEVWVPLPGLGKGYVHVISLKSISMTFHAQLFQINWRVVCYKAPAIHLEQCEPYLVGNELRVWEHLSHPVVGVHVYTRPEVTSLPNLVRVHCHGLLHSLCSFVDQGIVDTGYRRWTVTLPWISCSPRDDPSYWYLEGDIPGDSKVFIECENYYLLKSRELNSNSGSVKNILNYLEPSESPFTKWLTDSDGYYWTRTATGDVGYPWKMP